MQLSYLFAAATAFVSLIPGLLAESEAEFSRGTRRYYGDNYKNYDDYDNYGYDRRSNRYGKDYYGGYKRYRRAEEASTEAQAADATVEADKNRYSGYRHRNYYRDNYDHGRYYDRRSNYHYRSRY